MVFWQLKPEIFDGEHLDPTLRSMHGGEADFDTR